MPNNATFPIATVYSRSGEPDRYLITSVGLRLNRLFEPQLQYAELAETLRAAGVRSPTARQVSETVIGLRRNKLPDPSLQGNAGSFFKNPVIPRDDAESLLDTVLPVCLPGRPERTTSRYRRRGLIDQCGLKGAHEGGAAVSDRHALVIVNRGDATGRQVLRLARRVQSVVADTFGLTLEARTKNPRLRAGGLNHGGSAAFAPPATAANVTRWRLHVAHVRRPHARRRIRRASADRRRICPRRMP